VYGTAKRALTWWVFPLLLQRRWCGDGRWKYGAHVVSHLLKNITTTETLSSLPRSIASCTRYCAIFDFLSSITARIKSRSWTNCIFPDRHKQRDTARGGGDDDGSGCVTNMGRQWR
jgi:hypothetical protein